MTSPPRGTIVVSGGARGLGSAISRRLLADGYRLVVCGTAPSTDVTERIDELSSSGHVRYVQSDIRDTASVESLFGDIDDLAGAVANAGVYRGGRLIDMPTADWKHVIDVNLTGSFVFGAAAGRHLRDSNRPGSIVFVGTWAQDVPDWDTGAYSASKAGVVMLAKTLALELAEHGIRVNTVAAGIVDGGMAAERISTDSAFAERARRAVPLGRLQTEDEVAAAASFLLSPDSSYVTGSVLLADGGASLRQDNTI